MKEDQNADAWFSTMFDVYRLPPDFPEYEDARRKAGDLYDRVRILEEAFRREIGHWRFIPICSSMSSRRSCSQIQRNSTGNSRSTIVLFAR